jgi:hypothetical protein
VVCPEYKTGIIDDDPLPVGGPLLVDVANNPPKFELQKELNNIPEEVKEIREARVAILTCPFEPPKPKTKHGLEIKSVEDYEKLAAMEQQYFIDMVQ